MAQLEIAFAEHRHYDGDDPGGGLAGDLLGRPALEQGTADEPAHLLTALGDRRTLTAHRVPTVDMEELIAALG